MKNAKLLAKEVVRSNKQKDRLYVSKARLGSINQQLQEQLAIIKITGSVQKSTEIMKLSNQLIKLPQISAIMREMSMEMTKAGIMEEMLEDTLESVDEDPELEEEAEEEVDRVLFEITDGKLGVAGAGKELPTLNDEEEVANDADMARMQAQLNSLDRKSVV